MKPVPELELSGPVEPEAFGRVLAGEAQGGRGGRRESDACRAAGAKGGRRVARPGTGSIDPQTEP